jgi:hypothetical protein
LLISTNTEMINKPEYTHHNTSYSVIRMRFAQISLFAHNIKWEETELCRSEKKTGIKPIHTLFTHLLLKHLATFRELKKQCTDTKPFRSLAACCIRKMRLNRLQWRKSRGVISPFSKCSRKTCFTRSYGINQV